MKICIIGLGYMGLPTALFFAKEYPVIGFDIDKAKIENLRNKQLPFSEKGLEELFAQSHYFNATCDIEDIKDAQIYIISVPTPITEDKKIDLSHIRSAAETVIKVLKDKDLVILESSVKPNTTKDVLKPILDGTKKEYHLAYVSEKAIPGNTLYEMVHNDRIIGGIKKKDALMAKELYSVFVKGDFFLTDCTTAETVKLMENTYRDVNIALANEFAKLAENLKINVWEAIELANRHPRVNIHLPGPGVGGHCIAIDPWFLADEEARLIKTAREINDSMPRYVTGIIISKLKENQTVALLGAAYKKNVDDARESPCKRIAELLNSEKIRFIIHDPYIESFKFPVEKELDSVLEKADLIVVLTNHDIYNNLSTSKPIIDTRNMGIPKATVLGDYK